MRKSISYAEAEAQISAFKPEDHAMYEAVKGARDRIVADPARRTVTRRAVRDELGCRTDQVVRFLGLLEAFERGPETASPFTDKSDAAVLPSAIAQALSEGHSVLERVASVIGSTLRTVVVEEHDRTRNANAVQLDGAAKALAEARSRCGDFEETTDALAAEAAERVRIIGELRDERRAATALIETLKGELTAARDECARAGEHREVQNAQIARLSKIIGDERDNHRDELRRAHEALIIAMNRKLERV